MDFEVVWFQLVVWILRESIIEQVMLQERVVVLALRWQQKAGIPDHESALAVPQVAVAAVIYSVNLGGL